MSKASQARFTKEEILETLNKERETLQQFGVKRIGLFGSYLTGNATEKSDLDFVVEFTRKSFDGYMDLKEFLEDRFNCPVDLVIADAVKPALRQEIVEKATYASGLKNLDVLVNKLPTLKGQVQSILKEA